MYNNNYENAKVIMDIARNPKVGKMGRSDQGTL